MVGTRQPPATQRRGDPLLWALRAGWLVLPLAIGPSFTAALDGRSSGTRLVAEGFAWLSWFAGLVATFVPHPLGLTALRVGGPALVAVAGWSVVATNGEERGVAAVMAVVVALAVAGLALSAAVADKMVDGAAYGPERRFALRVPASLWLGPLPLAWVAVVLGGLAGPLLLGGGQLVGGLVAAVLGWPAAVVGARALHGLAERFVVFVPAGFVLHDRAALMEPVLVDRRLVARVGPASVGTAAMDLTMGALGLVAEARLSEPVELARRSGRRQAETAEVTALLFSPLRPGAFLREAAARGLPTG